MYRSMNKIKCGVVVFFSLSFLFLIAHVAVAEDRIMNQHIECGVAIGDTIYTIQDSNVLQINLATESEVFMEAYARYFLEQGRTVNGTTASLADWNGQLVLCDWAAEQVLTVEDGKVVVAAELALPGNGSTLFMNPVIIENRLYMLSQSVGEGRLYSADLTTGALARTVGGSYAAIVPWTYGRLLGMNYTYENTTVFSIIDAQGRIEQLIELDAGIGRGLVSDPEQGVFYVACGSVLYACQQGTLTQVRSTDAWNLLRFAALVDGQYVMQTESSCMVYDLKAGGQTPLVVRGIFYETSSGFALEHPEIALHSERSLGLTGEDIYTDLLMGGDEVDLYLVPYSSSVVKLIERGYAAVMPESEILQEDVMRLYSAYADCLSQDGQRYAVAAWVLCGAWTMQEELTGELPATMADAIAAQVAWSCHEANIGQLYLAPVYTEREWTAMDWMDAALTQIILARDTAERLDLKNHAALRRMMAELKSLYETAGLPLLAADVRVQPASGAGSVLVTEEMVPVLRGAVNEKVNFGLGDGILDFSGLSLESGLLVEPPQILEGEPMRYPAVLGVYILNPRSQHKEAALTYLEWMVQNRSANQRAALYQDCEPEIRDSAANKLETLEKQAAEGTISADEAEAQRQSMLSDPSSWLVWEGKLAFYREKMMPNLVVVRDPLLERSCMTSLPIYETLLSSCERYLAGNLSAQQALQNMQQVIDTWWMENQ